MCSSLEKLKVQINDCFTPWKRWSAKHAFEGKNYPGIYALAKSGKNLNGKPFDLIEDIIYFGMTNSLGGINNRLGQLDRTLKGKEGHGGAVRMRSIYDYDYAEFTKGLFVSIYPIKCIVSKEHTMPNDQRKMGQVAYLEYECFARYMEKFHRLPEFNDKKRSPKSSASQKRS